MTKYNACSSIERFAVGRTDHQTTRPVQEYLPTYETEKGVHERVKPGIKNKQNQKCEVAVRGRSTASEKAFKEAHADAQEGG